MKWIVLMVSCALCADVASGEETLRTIFWSELESQRRLLNGQVLPPDKEIPFERLKLANTERGGAVMTVLTIENPGVTEATYAVTGQVRCEDVEGEGYLEMWNHFPDGGAYFSRTAGKHGLLKHLTGSSAWRDFSLPFYVLEGTQRPEKLVINVVLPGRGTVYLGPLRLSEYARGEEPLAVQGQWWDSRTGGLIGGVAGTVMGTLGAVIGTLVSRGKARRFVMTALAVMAAIGVVAFIAGLIALGLSQPYAVYYPLLLLGVLLSALPLGLMRSVRRQYEARELRKMRALDAG